MRTRAFLFLLTLGVAFSLYGETELSVGPHFNYTRLCFNNPSHLQGYLAGVTAEVKQGWGDYFGRLVFEGSWNAGPVTGDPCQKSDLEEYFLELQISRLWCCQSLRVEPYVGFGWNRFENEQNPQMASLDYRYSKLFIPLGFYLNWVAFRSQWGAQFEFRPDVYSRLKLLGVSLDPDWGYAFRLQLPFSRDYLWPCGCFFLSTVPFFDWNRFGEVKITNSSGASLVIPRLTRWNLGVRVLLGYAF